MQRFFIEADDFAPCHEKSLIGLCLWSLQEMADHTRQMFSYCQSVSEAAEGSQEN